jgi:CBS domain-containing protein
MAATSIINELMTTTAVTARRTDVVGPIRDMMLESGIHCLPVTDENGHPVGIVSSWDLVEEYGSQESVENAMTSKVITIGGHQSVYEAATMMKSNFIHHLVVVDPANEVVGVLSSLDLLGEFIDEERLPPDGFDK